MLKLDQVKKALEASERKAQELGIAVTTAIVDEHGTLLAASRMDNAIVISPRFAFAKAYTSASLGMPSEALASYAEEGKPYFGITNLFSGELTSIAGGMPIMMNNQLVGGVGVGGSQDPKQDALCAEEAVKAFQS